MSRRFPDQNRSDSSSDSSDYETDSDDDDDGTMIYQPSVITSRIGAPPTPIPFQNSDSDTDTDFSDDSSFTSSEEDRSEPNPKFLSENERKEVENLLDNKYELFDFGRATTLFETSYIAVDKISGEKVIIKRLKPADDYLLTSEEEKREKKFIKSISLQHENVRTVKSYSLIKKQNERLNELFLISEYTSHGSVKDLMEKVKVKFEREYLLEHEICAICKSILLALKYLHKQDIPHKWIRSGNILVSENGKVKLDFIESFPNFHGLEKQTRSWDYGFAQFVYWMAPEIINQTIDLNELAHKSDIWSLGISVLEMAEGNAPLESTFHPLRALFLISSRPPPKLTKNPGFWSERMKDFLRKCLQKDPKNRPSAEDLLRHPWIKDLVDYEEEVEGLIRKVMSNEQKMSQDDERERLRYLQNDFKIQFSRLQVPVKQFQVSLPKNQSSFECTFYKLFFC